MTREAGPRLRRLVDAPAAGAWNMAVDEVLLESAAAGQPSLRFYGWTPATLSLGYFQRAADRLLHPASQHCPLVRRESGGGAIVHDRELTYALALPVHHPLAVDPPRLYRLLHGTLAEVLSQWGISARLRSAAEAKRPSPEPFLCFQRRAEGDLVRGEFKVAGSAQRRRSGALLQHGSVLLARSTAAPELPGLEDLGNTAPRPGELIDSWCQRLGELGLRSEPTAGLSSAEQVSSAAWVESRFGQPSWNDRR